MRRDDESGTEEEIEQEGQGEEGKMRRRDMQKE